jgi:chromosome segregation protein
MQESLRAELEEVEREEQSKYERKLEQMRREVQ